METGELPSGACHNDPDTGSGSTITRRIVIAGLACALLVALVAWLDRPASPAATAARSLLGDRWYSLRLDEKHLGYWHTSNRRDGDGNWVFESEQRFAMNPYDPVSTASLRVFEAHPPHRLLVAEHRQTRRDHVDGLRIELTDGEYRSTRLPEGAPASAPLGWSYTLAEYLEFELWLDTEQPHPGQSRTVTTLDFDRSTLVNRSFDIVDVNELGYAIENAAPLSATHIQLDQRYVPVAIDVAGLFSLRLTSRAEALAPRSILQLASYYIPTDRRLIDHTHISRLVLDVRGDESPASLFSNIEQLGDQWRLTLTANPTTGGSVSQGDLAETLHIPSGHPAIGRLATRAVDDLDDDLARARALNRFVHDYLSYRPGTPPRGVLGLLEERSGDCTEFADLLTTLARRVGLPARTVFGLAYSDGDTPAFTYHAWNELFVNGAWRAFDPTWGQDRVDATHIPLPDNEEAALKLLTGSVDLAFSIAEVEHFADG
jgi:hypothetical protein